MTALFKRTILTFCMSIMILMPLAHAQIYAFKFDDAIFSLRYAGRSHDVITNEFFTEGHDPINWNKMIMVQYYVGTSDISVLDFANRHKAQLESLYKSTSFEMPAPVNEGEILMTFILKQEKPDITEYNLYRFGRHYYTNDVISMEFAFRIFGPVENGFADHIEKGQKRWPQMISTMSFPKVIYPWNE